MSTQPSVRRGPSTLLWLLLRGLVLWLVVGCGRGTLYVPMDSGRGNWLSTGGGPGGVAALEGGPQPPLELLWSQNTGAAPVGGALLAGPLVLQATQSERVYAFDLVDGQRVGRRGSKAAVCGPATIAGRFSETLVLSEAGRKPRLRGYDRRTGKVAWEIESSACAPLVGRSDTVLSVTDAGNLLALASDDGSQLWVTALPHHPSTGAVFTDDVAVVGGADGAVMALNLEDGSVRWETRLLDGVAVRGQPLSTADQVFAATGDGQIWAMSRDGHVEWSAGVTGLPAQGMSLMGEVLVVGTSDRSVYGLSTVDGRQLWRYEAGGIIRGAPATTSTTVYLGSTAGYLDALSLETGEQVWTYELDAPVRSSIVLAKDLLTVTTQVGTVYLFAAQSALR